MERIPSHLTHAEWLDLEVAKGTDKKKKYCNVAIFFLPLSLFSEDIRFRVCIFLAFCGSDFFYSPKFIRFGV
ncbi:MAG: hypothetical protein IJN80_03905 [Clostridia bacterium]|nr:hypothetical protein [Clostridia bacterium]